MVGIIIPTPPPPKYRLNIGYADQRCTWVGHKFESIFFYMAVLHFPFFPPVLEAYTVVGSIDVVFTALYRLCVLQHGDKYLCDCSRSLLVLLSNYHGRLIEQTSI